MGVMQLEGTLSHLDVLRCEISTLLTAASGQRRRSSPRPQCPQLPPIAGIRLIPNDRRLVPTGDLSRCRVLGEGDLQKQSGVFTDGTEHVYRGGYFTRLSTSSTTPPPDPASLVHFSSSPVTVIVRVCSAPIQFGNVLWSILSVKILPATE